MWCVYHAEIKFFSTIRNCLKRVAVSTEHRVHLGTKTQTYPTDLANRYWDCIKDLVPAAKAGGRPRSLDMRQVINAILYILVTGAQ